MSTASDIAVNLLSAAIGGALAVTWRVGWERYRLRRFRAFWQSFVRGPSVVVTGMLSPEILTESFPASLPEPRRAAVSELLPELQGHIAGQELSGLMGGGDRKAVERIQSGLARAGLPRNLPEKDESGVADHASENLILVGGPDVNRVSRTFMADVGCNLIITRDDKNRNVVRDLLHGKDYGVTATPGSPLRDYGVIIRAKNPNDESSFILILAGAHGFGSLAAAEVCFSYAREMADHARNDRAGFECLVCYEHDGNASGSAPRSSLVYAREIQRRSASLPGAGGPASR